MGLPREIPPEPVAAPGDWSLGTGHPAQLLLHKEEFPQPVPSDRDDNGDNGGYNML